MSLQRRFDEAHALLYAICPRGKLDDQLLQRSPELVVRYLLERGRTLNSSGQRADAFSLFGRAWDHARSAGCDALAVDAAHMLAIAADDSDQALHWNTRAMELAQSSPDSKARAWRGSLENNLGWTWHARGDYARALGHFESALRCRQEDGSAGLIAIARWCIARCLRSLGRIEEALAIQRELLDEHHTRGTPDGFVHEELGECLLAAGDPAAARRHFAKAYDVLARDQSLVHNEPERIKRIRRLANGDDVAA